MSLLGELGVGRAYYHCKHCRKGHCPWDAAPGLGASDLTPAARRACALAGVPSGFAAAAAKTPPELCGLRLSGPTVERATEAAGAELGRRLAAGETFGPAEDWEWPADAEGESVAFVSADLTGVETRGPGGGPAEGRMAAVAMVYHPGRPGKPGEAGYPAGLTGGLAALAGPIRARGARVGTDRAERWVAISGGGSGIEDRLASDFPRAEAVILDFPHAAEHLGEWAKAVHPGDEASAARMAGAWCSWLEREGGESVLTALEGLDVGRRAGARQAHGESLTDFGNQAHRMDYPGYRAKGWPIGSGPVEACRKLVGQRLKGAGMRWSEAGADAVLRLRALFKSEKGQSDAFWAVAA